MSGVQTAPVGRIDRLRDRAGGAFTVDVWGMDVAWHTAAIDMVARRFSIRTGGRRRIPAEGPTMVVVNRGLGWTEPAVAATAIREVTGRRARVVGLPDRPVVGSFLRRFGAVLANPDEVTSLLRAGELVLVPLRWRPVYGVMAGSLDVGIARAAVETGATVLPSVARGREWGRSWDYTVSTALDLPAAVGRQPAVDLAEAVRAAIQRVL